MPFRGSKRAVEIHHCHSDSGEDSFPSCSILWIFSVYKQSTVKDESPRMQRPGIDEEIKLDSKRKTPVKHENWEKEIIVLKVISIVASADGESRSYEGDVNEYVHDCRDIMPKKMYHITARVSAADLIEVTQSLHSHQHRQLFIAHSY